MFARILLFLLAFGHFSQAANLKTKYQLVISGAGPGGLSAALSAIKAGVPADQILVIEKRVPNVDRGYATRSRVVVLESASLRILQNNGVPTPGVPLREMISYDDNNRRYFFPNRGAWKSGIGSFYGGRSLDRMTSIRDLELLQLQTFQELGGKVLFGETPTLTMDAKTEVSRLKIKNKTIEAEMIVIAEGAASATLQNIPRVNIAENTTSHFFCLDIPLSENNYVRRGDMISYINAKHKFIVYAFTGSDVVSVNMMLPPKITRQDLESNPALRSKYLNVLRETARTFGIEPSPKDKGVIYDGSLSMTDRVLVGNNVVIIGDALRKVDAISGTGANSALMDGELIGEYFANRSSGKRAAKEKLIEGLTDNTRTAFEFSLFFREMVAKTHQSPELLRRMQILGLSDREGGRSLMDLGKDFYANLLVGMAGSQRQSETIEAVITSAGGPPAPFKSRSREHTIGPVHQPTRSCKRL